MSVLKNGDSKGEVILQLYKIQPIILTYSNRITVICVTPNYNLRNLK